MNTTTQKNIIEKRKSNAFGKDIYLLGCDSEGIFYWLEAPKWDCGWYWGFGYVETYTNNSNPSKAKDIESHQHVSGFMGEQEYYDIQKSCFRKGDYIHNLYDSKKWTATVFDEKTGWTLSELFKSFYHLKESAEVFGRGGSLLTTNPCKETIENKEWAKHINEVMIPAVTKKIIELLAP